MAFIFDVKVIPNAGRSGWVMDKTGQLKCYLKSPPERGRANKELIKSVAQALGIARDMVLIIAGKMGRKKKIKVDVEMDYNMLLEALGIEWQMDMFG